MFFLGWHEIRQTLYDFLPEDVVEFGKRFRSYSDEGEAGICVRFKVLNLLLCRIKCSLLTE